MGIVVEKTRLAAKHLGEGQKVYVTAVGSDGIMFDVDGVEYLIVNEEEREVEVRQYIAETLWAFKPSFLSDMTGLDIEVFEVLSELYERGNEAILKLVEAACGLGDLVEDAVMSDGYGHYLSPYDGEEIELENGYYAYRLS